MPEDPFYQDRDIRSTLLDAGGRAQRHATLPGPARLRRRARTRSAATVLGAATLSVLAVVGVLIGVGLPDLGPPPVPAAPTVTVPSTVPDDLDLGEGLPQGSEYTTRTVDGFPADVCPGLGIPGIGRAVEQRFLQTNGPEYGEGRGLLVFADAGAAVAFMTGLRTAVDGCASGVPRPGGGTRDILREDLPGAWATGVTLFLVDVPDPDGDPQPAIGSYLFAVRTGSAVLLVSRTGENLLFEPPYRIDPEVVAINRRPLDVIAPQLCRWTVAGC